MKLHAEKLYARFYAHLNYWRVDLGEFKFWIRALGITRIKNVKMKWQIVEAEDVDLELIGDWLFIHKWGKINKKRLYYPYNPDQPRNLAKCVTVP